MRSERPELVLLDVWMPEVDGIELLRSLQEEPDRPQVIMISGHGNIETAVQATKLGAFDFIEKPFSIDALLAVVNRALEHRALQGGEAGAGTAAARPVPGSNGHTQRSPARAHHRQVGHRQRPRAAHRGEIGTDSQPVAGRTRHRLRQLDHRGVGAGTCRLRRLDRLRDDAATAAG